LGLIREAHRRARAAGVAGTDDAQLVERLGHPVAIVAGSRLNIKITTPDDLHLAEALWRHGRPAG
jgi:2-C-methyl-D-erythritol 4-phosphate cytidylyltransferase